jgi:hypothetical protein
VARITAQMMTGPNAVLRAVMTKTDLASIPEEKQITPAVHVVFDGFLIAGQGAELEMVALQSQRWITVVAVANSARMREAAARNQDAGPLLFQLFKALHGFVPAPGLTKLAPLSPPRAYYSAGFAYFPLAWTTSMTHCNNEF